ncbi:MAG: 2-C-methyl-D-erythritol 4-phosphate cytidylyltransferase [Lentisphaeraceae bacterium]|nr:2-C-methyl-D-erythritol 4-phosphate cytidylyltransferase [Lentisphaeraceae bacterium]
MKSKITDLGVVIVAGGNSSRFGEQDKLLIEIDSTPIFVHSVNAFLQDIPNENIVLVTSKGRELELQGIIQDKLGVQIKTVTGGANRSDSSLNGLNALPTSMTYCAVHDAARPFIEPQTIHDCYNSLLAKGSAVLAHPVTDTIKVIDSDNKVIETPVRSSLCAAETPQMFKTQELIKAYENAPKDGTVTDEAMAMEKAGLPVFLHIHEKDNRKITYVSDLK